MWGTLLEKLAGKDIGSAIGRVLGGGRKEVPASKPVPPTNPMTDSDPLGGMPAARPRTVTEPPPEPAAPALEQAASPHARTRYSDPIRQSRHEFTDQRVNQSKPRRIFTGLMSGIANSRPGASWGEMLGGGIGGSVSNIVNPGNVADRDFDRYHLPQLERERMRQWEIEKRRQEVLDAEQNREYKKKQGENLDADNTFQRDRLAQQKVLADAKANQPRIVNGVLMTPDGRVLNDPRIKIDASGQYVRQWNPDTGQMETSTDEAGAPIESARYLAIQAGIENNKRTNSTRLRTTQMNNATSIENNKRNSATSAANTDKRIASGTKKSTATPIKNFDEDDIKAVSEHYKITPEEARHKLEMAGKKFLPK